MSEKEIRKRYGYGFCKDKSKAYAYPVKYGDGLFELFEFAPEDNSYVLIKSDANFDECQKWIAG